MAWLVEILRIYLELVLHHKRFNIAKNPKYDRYQKGLVSMVYEFFDKRSSHSGVKREVMLNQQLPEELHEQIIRKFEKRKVYSSFKDNIWGADLTYSQLLSKFNKVFRFLLCIIDIIVNIRGLLLSRTKRYYNY